MESNTVTNPIVKERPILFSTSMVQAILAGRKTVTRRLNGWDERVNQNPDNWKPVGSDPVYPGDREEEDDINSYCDFQTHDTVWMALNKYPAQVGDILWVRETFAKIHYEGVDEKPSFIYKADNGNESLKQIWKPSIFMPREACRLKLEIISIGIERLHDITEEDAIREGLSKISKDGGRMWKYGIPDNDGLPGTDDNGWPWTDWNTFANEAFFTLWRKINGDESFQSNPWVWRIEFKRI